MFYVFYTISMITKKSPFLNIVAENYNSSILGPTCILVESREARRRLFGERSTRMSLEVSVTRWDVAPVTDATSRVCGVVNCCICQQLMTSPHVLSLSCRVPGMWKSATRKPVNGIACTRRTRAAYLCRCRKRDLRLGQCNSNTTKKVKRYPGFYLYNSRYHLNTSQRCLNSLHG